MSDIYLQGSQLHLSLHNEKIIVRNEEKEIVREVGLDKIDNILIFGQSQLTTQLIRRLALKKVNVFYFTTEGRFISFLDTMREADFEKQKYQAKSHFDDVFRLEIARSILSTKMKHQIHLLKAFDEDKMLSQEDYQRFNNSLKQLETAVTIAEMMGFEGRCAKSYFYYLNLLAPSQFRFYGRSRRPAKDCFNTLLNFGYSILYSFMIGMIRKNGLSQGFGMIHDDRHHHATLASDLMEEWRPIIVDNTVMTILRDGLLTLKDFEECAGGVYLTQHGRKVFLKALSSRMLEIHSFIEEDRKRYSFIYMADMQILSLIKAFQENKPELYIRSYTG
ncbi:CRISPR-associated endonuclease Cas1 [Streptococcus dentapri]|uniref:CRISPR-associated endonuclease Cas1 n=1 Tax=Streptococcus dentapri TaxID=573564 RepID=A0ABV8CZV7_9STRE